LHHLSTNPRCHHQGFFATYTGILFSGTAIRITNSDYIIIIVIFIIIIIPIPVAVQSKAWVCDSLLSGIAGANPTGGMDV